MTRATGRYRVNRILGGIKILRGKRRTGSALYYAKKYLFSGRPQCGRKRVLVVLTSGVSVDRVVKPSKSLVSIGVEIFVVTTSRGARSQMQQISTTRQHVFIVSYKSAVSVVSRLASKICVSPKGKISAKLNITKPMKSQTR
jgi:hypothetical protein